MTKDGIVLKNEVRELMIAMANRVHKMRTLKLERTFRFLCMVLEKEERKLMIADGKESTYDENVERTFTFLSMVLTFQLILDILGDIRHFRLTNWY